jgi:hypothetical protein
MTKHPHFPKKNDFVLKGLSRFLIGLSKIAPCSDPALQLQRFDTTSFLKKLSNPLLTPQLLCAHSEGAQGHAVRGKGTSLRPQMVLCQIPSPLKDQTSKKGTAPQQLSRAACWFPNGFTTV